MSFEPEDKLAWDDSEVMREFEKIAQDIYDEADASFQPIELGKKVNIDDEDIGADDEKIAENIFGKLEMFSSINKDLFDKIRIISHSLANRGLKKEAFKIERALKDLSGRRK